MNAQARLVRKPGRAAATSAGSAAWLFEGAEDLFVETGPDGRIKAANDAWRRIGWARRRLAGRLLRELIHPHDLDALDARRPFRLRCADEGWRRMEGQVRVMPDGGVVAVFRPTDAPDDAFAALARTAGVWSWTLDPAAGKLQVHGAPPRVRAARSKR